MVHHKWAHRGHQSNHFDLIKQNGEEMWANVTIMRTRQTNARTEPKRSQRRQCSEFARNRPSELIRICSNTMARKCEQAWHSCEQDKPFHVLSDRIINPVSAPSSLGIDPVSWLVPNGTELQGNVSKRDIYANKTNQQCTYGATF
jgi:hypothetical protein